VQLSSPVPLSSGVHIQLPARSWGDVLSVLPSTDARLLMFVRPIATPTDVCCPKSQHTCETPDCNGWQGSNVLDITLTGRAGECCDDATPGHPNPGHHHEASHHTSEEAAKRLLVSQDPGMDESFASKHELEVRYFGLVSQSRSAGGSDGCYLVKTVRQRNAVACNCMHYSLMRVCHGTALTEQVMSFWR
jgi:hypothetical protein